MPKRKILIEPSARGFHVSLPYAPTDRAKSAFHEIKNEEGEKMAWVKTMGGEVYWFIPRGVVHPTSRAPRGSACVEEARAIIQFHYPDFCVSVATETQLEVCNAGE